MTTPVETQETQKEDTLNKEHTKHLAMCYYSAFKHVNPDLMRQIFLPEAVKFGWLWDNQKWVNGMDGTGSYALEKTIELVKAYNVSGHMPETPVQIDVLELQSKIAVVRLIAEWRENHKGIDLLMLVKDNNNNWRIGAVLWQSLE
jgi:hypothetical protein